MARYFDNFLVFFSFFSRIELFLNPIGYHCQSQRYGSDA